MLIDSHAHLDMSQFGQDREEVLQNAIKNGIGIIITIGCDIPSSRKAVDLAHKHPQIYATVGFHPHDASKLDSGTLPELRKMAELPKVVGIGEIGLDFYRNRSPRSIQIEAFEKQLALAAELDLPVVIHDREAHQETTTILKDWTLQRRLTRPAGPLGVLHCFSGDVAMAEEFVASGFMVSIPGPVTYPNSNRLVDVVKAISLDNLIIETDCPYLTPQQFRGKRNEPAYVKFVAEEIAKIKKATFEEVAQATTDNTISLFRLPSTLKN